jgi:hypothetical protein
LASVDLSLVEACGGLAPPICVCCGAPAAARKNHTAYVGLAGLPFMVFPLWVIIHATRIQLCLPFCSRHSNYWLWRRCINLGSLALMIVVVVALCVLQPASQPVKASRQADSGLGWLCILALVLPVVWLIAYAIHCQVNIRVTRHNKEALRLEGVCDEFVAAVKAARVPPWLDVVNHPIFWEWFGGQNRSGDDNA